MSEKLKKPRKKVPTTNFGLNLKFLRRLNGLSQSELAKNIGLTRNNVASYESGLVEPNTIKFINVCNYFNIAPKQMLEDLLSENPAQAVHIDINTKNPVDNYVADQLASFVVQTNEMTKVLEGYKAFFELKKANNDYENNRELYATLEDLLELLSSLVHSNWGLIQSIYPSDESE